MAAARVTARAAALRVEKEAQVAKERKRLEL